MAYFPTAFRACALCIMIAALSGCATDHTAAKPDANMLARLQATVHEAVPGVQLGLQLSASQVKVGDTVAARLTSNRPGFVYLMQMSTDGHALRLLFPNTADGANYMDAGSMQLPRSGWSIASHGPAGLGYLMAVITPEPLDLPGLQAQIAYGTFAMHGRYGAVLVPLRETAH